MRTVLTFGTFDILHIGHVRILERARAFGDRLIVGVSTDALNFSKKGRNPVYPEQERMQIVASLRVVDAVFPEESLEKKADYIKQHGAHVLVMGNDWEGKFDHFRSLCEVEYLPRTLGISTTELIAEIKKYA